MRQHLAISPPTTKEVEALDTLYRTTKHVLLRARAQIIFEFVTPAKASAILVGSTAEILYGTMLHGTLEFSHMVPISQGHASDVLTQE